MKTIKTYLLGASLALAAGAVVGCQDHFDAPETTKVPVATMVANTTIAEFKEMMWDESNNYCNPIPAKEDGSHIIISGRVISSDFAGNCFKYIILQDETGALSFSINSYNLYLQYRRGQEIVVDLTEMYAGKYRGLEQCGFPSFNTSINGDETSFMSPELFRSHAELNGLPNREAIDTITVESFASLDVTPAGLRKWQSQLVRFNNVEFVPNTTLGTLSSYHSSGETQQIRDAAGDVLDVRTSGYANFWTMKLPEGRCDVTAILGYYVNLAGTGGWQLTLIDANAIQNVGNPTVPAGHKGNPYSIAQAVALEEDETAPAVNAWIKGYIVGAVAPEVENVTSSADIEWEAPTTLGNTLVIGETADTRDLKQCIIVALPQGSALRTQGSLRENPANLGKEILLQGSLERVMGTFGLTTAGLATQFEIEGQTPVNPDQGGDGTEANPYNCAQIIKMAPSSTTEAVKTGVWAKGYIVGYYENYEAHFEASQSQAANILLADAPDVTDAAKCICIQLVAQTDARNALNLKDNPGNLGKVATVLGDVMKYNTLPGIKNTTSYTLEGGSGNEPTPPQPADPVSSIDESFATGIPTTWSQVQIAGNKAWYQTEFDSQPYAAMTGYKGTAPFDQWLVTPPIDMAKVDKKVLSFDNQQNGYGSTTSKFEVYVMTQADTKGTNTKLTANLATAPASGYSGWVNSGDIDLSAYTGLIYIGFRYSATQDANYATWCVTKVKVGESGGGDTPEPGPGPQPPVGDGVFDFANPTTLSGAFDINNTTPDNSNTKVDVGGVTFTSGEATVVNTGTGTAARLYHQTSTDAWSYRIYKGSTTTIAVAAGYHIDSITFEVQTATHATALGKCQYSTGTYADKVWTPADKTTTKVEITDSDAGTVAFTKITVNYSK